MPIHGTAPQTLTIRRGDTLALPARGLPDLIAAAEIWFTVKRYLSDADATAQIQISESGGLLAIAGSAATTPLNGSITVPAAGQLLITLAASETAELSPVGVHYWDIQARTGDVVETIVYGSLAFIGDATRRTT